MSLSTLIQQVLFLPSREKTIDDWKVAGCSQPGTAHLRRGRTCEDANGWFISNGLLAIAVADGAGSAAQAALGSTLAVSTTLSSLLDSHTKGCPITNETAKSALGLACQCTLNALSAKATELGAEPSDLASTLIIVVASRNFCTAGQIGDGSVVVTDDNENFIALTTPTTGEFTNETALLGCTPAMDVQIGSLPEYCPKSIVVLTDGLQRLALQMPHGIPHAPFFRPLFKRFHDLPESEMETFLKEFLNSPCVNNRTDDDKTLVTAHVL